MGHFFIVANTVEGVVTPTVVDFAAFAGGWVGWVGNWETEFASEGDDEDVVVESVGGFASAHVD